MAYFGSDYEALAHHWVYNFDISHCYGYRMYSENYEIYSYGYHHMIAKYFPKEDCFIVDVSGGSKTTTKQTRAVLGAIPYHELIFQTNQKPDSEPKVLIEGWFNSIERLLPKYKRARSRKDEYAEQINTYISYIKKYVELFKVKYKFSKLQKVILESSFEVSEAALEDARKKDEAKEKRQYRKQIKEWCEGLRPSLPSAINEVYLRVSSNGEYIESSKSAALPMETARELYNDLLNNCLKDSYGGFRTVLNKDTLIIGCHKVKMKEIERVMK